MEAGVLAVAVLVAAVALMAVALFNNARNKYDEAAAALDRAEVKLEGIEAARDQPALPGLGS